MPQHMHANGDVAEIREALLRSIVLTPDAVDDRETLWIAFFRAKYSPRP
jgi:hypothetical protein